MASRSGEGHCRAEGQRGSAGQAGGAEPGFPREERGGLVAEPNTTFGDWRELSGYEQKKGRGRLRNGTPGGNEGSECQAGVEIKDTSLTSEVQSGTTGGLPSLRQASERLTLKWVGHHTVSGEESKERNQAQTEESWLERASRHFRESHLGLASLNCLLASLSLSMVPS